jgi:hypothetical protein
MRRPLCSPQASRHVAPTVFQARAARSALEGRLVAIPALLEPILVRRVRGARAMAKSVGSGIC